ncbi:DNA-dependent metalloprotease WSS1 isoform X3 [Jatropha curcas]|uniref:DNA-dependent metalloprotease WSS1 isoform X3 n=1 Tax=Jatropha curcas TaxID=180498 RepID=UPI0005FC1A3D|nr:DNA-dependent metalloprotease WSS1 isoform X3 [Jatropha curcas]
MNLGDLHKVWEIKALKKPGEEEAKKMLEKIAKQVQPIMRKHKWRVKVLSEFCPNNPALLGLNVGGGVQVKLRLRRPNRDWDFFPFDQVLDTMLHELCHNVHGPHNANFYKLWDELRKECEELLSKRISGTGEGFDLPGRRLGGFSRQPPLSSLHKTALAAAEKRAKMGTILPSGPQRLGGDSTIMVALSPIQAAAMAAERRLQDEIWCGSQSAEVYEDGECSTYMAENLDNKWQTAGSSRPDNGSIPTHDMTHNPEEHAMWECRACTLLNPPLAPVCELCCTEKPKDASTKYKTWSCKFCTLENSIKLEKCSACSQWRYSYGPPVSTPAPNLGT